jgi:tetratricopeptide (TPR) repeat protein
VARLSRYSGLSSYVIQRQAAKRQQASLVGVVRASSSEAAAGSASKASGAAEEYDVYLPKPIGVKFARGNDGGAYVTVTDPRLGNTSSDITPGDKVVKISASFGSDVWDALNFGQVIYAIKTRNGEVYMRLKKNYGDMSALEEEELTEAEKKFREERSGGNYGAGTKEMQAKNYIGRKEAERKRRELFDEALAKFRSGKTEEALIDFENVLSMEPKNYLGDDFARVTTVYRITQYNIACCYSTLDQIDAGLEALDSAMACGFEDFAKVRKDPNLANIRKSPKFTPLINKYDEPIINEGAVKALKSIFSFGRKDDDDL